ncbi:GGDEF domain-containing protein [Demequina aurantiaca]|uniref:GGDEF domain-containing protein n=1 Tax=Demequina aurantiaca TaxID=676200 RepID=UPI000782219E|nr:diguanylate cyclase [Demequina aurantiaca]
MGEPQGANGGRGDAYEFDAPAITGEIPVPQESTSPRAMVAFSLAGLAFGLFYVVWFLVAYPTPRWLMVAVSVLTVLVFSSGVAFARTRFATPLAIGIVTFAAFILLVYTAVLSTDSSVHMLYLAAGFAMLALFPEPLWRLRIVYAGAMITLVVACEFLFAEPAVEHLVEVGRDSILAAANRLWTVVVVAMGMGIVLYRSTRRQRDLSGAAELGEYLASTDVMTGIANRRPVLAQLHEFDDEKVSRYAVAIIDIDGFKAINDRLGHEEGDALISAIARRLRAHFRQTDLVSRWGGDEFLVVLPNITREELFSVLDRLRMSVATSPFSLGADPIAVTLSAGAAIAGAEDNSREVIRAADLALYTAKHTGRNRVVLADDSTIEAVQVQH